MQLQGRRRYLGKWQIPLCPKTGLKLARECVRKKLDIVSERSVYG